MSSTLVASGSADSFSSTRSTPETALRSASSLSTSSRRSSSVRSVTGSRSVSRSPGSRTSIIPSTSSFSSAVSRARPASSGVAAPPPLSSLVSWVIPKTAPAAIAAPPTTRGDHDAGRPLLRRRGARLQLHRRDRDLGRPGARLRGLPDSAVAHDSLLSVECTRAAAYRRGLRALRAPDRGRLPGPSLSYPLRRACGGHRFPRVDRIGADEPPRRRRPRGRPSGALRTGPRRHRVGPAHRSPRSAALAGVDVVVNLAGAGIGDHRWTDDYKREIRDSRTRGTALVSE